MRQRHQKYRGQRMRLAITKRTIALFALLLASVGLVTALTARPAHAANSLTLSPSGAPPVELPYAQYTAPYTTTITASGGNGTYTFALTIGRLPSGLTLASDGTISGTTDVDNDDQEFTV